MGSITGKARATKKPGQTGKTGTPDKTGSLGKSAAAGSAALAALVLTAGILLSSCANNAAQQDEKVFGETAVASNSVNPSDSNVGGMTTADAIPTAAAVTAAMTAAPGAASDVDSKLLLEKLDKESDETIRYVYGNSPDNLTVGQTFKGYFSDSGNPELLAIIKLLGVPHAGGLDCSVAALYDGETMELIAQKTFPYDECRFDVLTDEKQKSYLLFTGSMTNQGYSRYTLGLWKAGRIWEQLYFPEETEVDSKKFEPDENRAIRVSYATYDTSGSEPVPEITWLHKYDLVWNRNTGNLETVIPSEYKDAGGNPNVDAVSVSPDGRYAISTLPDQHKVLVYDTEENRLASTYQLLVSDYGFLWSPDSSKVCVTLAARIWKDICVIDMAAGKTVEFPSTPEILKTFGEKGDQPDYELNKSRPDPYLTPLEWSPDSMELLVFYQWTDTKYYRQNGTFVFNVGKGRISKIVQNKVDREHDNIPAKKPEGFSW